MTQPVQPITTLAALKVYLDSRLERFTRLEQRICDLSARVTALEVEKTSQPNLWDNPQVKQFFKDYQQLGKCIKDNAATIGVAAAAVVAVAIPVIVSIATGEAQQGPTTAHYVQGVL